VSLPEVACIHRARREAVLENGETIPVVRFTGPDGEPTDDVDEAVSCVAGPDASGLWVCIDLTAFDKVTVQ
jgi:hypothetical protein